MHDRTIQSNYDHDRIIDMQRPLGAQETIERKRSGRRSAQGRKQVPAAKSIPTWILLAIIAFLGCLASHSLLGTGHPLLGDAWPHLARAKVLLTSFQQGNFFPIWDFTLYSGYSFLQFYGPAYYYFTALMAHFANGDILTATKWVCFLCHVLSGFSMFFFLRRVWLDAYAACIGSCAYILTFWHLFHIFYMGRYPVALIYLSNPIALYCVMLVLEKRNLPRSVLLGLVLGAQLLIHPIYAFFSGLFLFSVFLVSVRKPTIAATFVCGTIAVATAALTSAFSSIPFFLEGMQESFGSTPAKEPNPVLLEALVTWSKGITPLGNWHKGAYIGLSISILALVGAIDAIGRKRILRSPFWAASVLAIFLVFGSGLPGHAYFTSITGGFIPKRFLVFFILFLSVWAAEGYRSLVGVFGSRNTVFALAMAALCIDLVPTAFQHYPTFQQAIGGRSSAYAVADQAPGTLVDIGKPNDNVSEYGRYIRYPGMQQLYSACPTPGGYFPQFAPRSSWYTYKWINDIAIDLMDTRYEKIGAKTEKIIALLGIKYLMTFPPLVRNGETDFLLAKQGLDWYGGGLESPGDPALLARVRNPTPLLVSNRIEPWSCSGCVDDGTAPDAESLLDSMTIDGESLRSRTFYSRKLAAPSIRGEKSGHPIVRDYVTRISEVTLNARTADQAYCRLPVSYDKRLAVSLNGKPVSALEGADHFLIIPLDAGDNAIRITPMLSSLRKICLGLSLVTLSILMIYGLYLLRIRRGR